MNVNFEYYHIFYVVASVGNITKAAQQLMISQPAISKSIKNLEQQLGGTLFVRTKRGVHLTEEGKEFYQYIKQAMEFIQNAENKFTDLIHLDTGTIRIGVSTTLTKFFLISYLKEFHELYPHIEIQISTSLSTELVAKLRQGLLDCLVLNLPFNDSKDIEIRKVKEIQDCFVVGKNYLDLTKNQLSLEDLNQYPIILQARGSVTRKFLDEFCYQNHTTLQPSMEPASFSLVTELVKSGLGIGYSTREFIQKELNQEELYILPVKPTIPSRSIGLAYSKRTMPSFCTRKFLELILDKDKL